MCEKELEAARRKTWRHASHVQTGSGHGGGAVTKRIVQAGLGPSRGGQSSLGFKKLSMAYLASILATSSAASRQVSRFFRAQSM